MILQPMFRKKILLLLNLLLLQKILQVWFLCLHLLILSIPYSTIIITLIFLANALTIHEPQTYHQAREDSNWVLAMKNELEALEKNDT